MAKIWKICSNGVGTTVNNIWNAMKWLLNFAGKIWIKMLDWIGGIWKGLMERVGIIWKELKALAEWVFASLNSYQLVISFSI